LPAHVVAGELEDIEACGLLGQRAQPKRTAKHAGEATNEMSSHGLPQNYPPLAGHGPLLLRTAQYPCDRNVCRALLSAGRNGVNPTPWHRLVRCSVLDGARERQNLARGPLAKVPGRGPQKFVSELKRCRHAGGRGAAVRRRLAGRRGAARGWRTRTERVVLTF
jgi:hypothetical protein